MRGWGISTPEDLTGWLRRREFQGASLGHHISANAQEFLLGQACAVDGRVALLEAVYVQLAIHRGSAMDDQFLQRVPMLKKCPHFLRGRLRHCFGVDFARESSSEARPGPSQRRSSMEILWNDLHDASSQTLRDRFHRS